MTQAGLETHGTAARMLAALIALAAWAGIAVHFHALADGPASWLAALWALAGYFTITTNLLVAIVFTSVVIKARFATPWLLSATLLNILLVGIVYGLLLQGLKELTAGSQLANILLHRVTPALTTVFWLAFVRKGTLTWRAPFVWALYPLFYLAYALVRGAAEAHYPYPFIDVARIGWEQTLVNSALIALAFVAAGEVLVWLDRRLGGKTSS
ncbi:Pr6Pr family membrane protein [Mesorhizobium sp. VK4C]|uniref:Pr6Pr family membrane protein n=1 Tax=Mesorhizobium captivum TaxID=3072319 RepID=UPI002A24B11D|nr:Pr6Pr family membrane protein [Mesorhizobium sp. VK4C]MDX8500935.1 Pr6Pr family membrane protein [Mesorhizobium sp. VK4C]